MSESLAEEITACRRLRYLGKYSEAINNLETLLAANKNHLLIRGELAETLIAQGYDKKALDLVDSGLQNAILEGNDEVGLAYLQMQRHFYAGHVNCLFDEALKSAEEIYQTSIKRHEDGRQIDRSMVFTISFYCRLLCMARIVHKKVPSDPEILAERILKPMFTVQWQRGRYRECLRIAMDYKRCMTSDDNCVLLKQIVGDLCTPPLVKADALMDLLENLIPTEYQNALKQAREIYNSHEHVHGALDVSLREACDRISMKVPEQGEDLPFNDYLARYDSMNYLRGKEAALDQISNVLDHFSSIEVQLNVLHESREVLRIGGSLLINSMRDLKILSRWLIRAGHSAKIIENATSVWENLEHTDCQYMQGFMAQILSQAYLLVEDQQNATKWGLKCQELWDECLPSDRSQGRTIALRAEASRKGFYSSLEEEKLFEETRKHVEEDINNGFIENAVEKLEVLILELLRAPGRSRQDEDTAKKMIDKVEQLVDRLPQDTSMTKLINLYQTRISALLAEGKNRSDIKNEEEGLELSSKAIEMCLKAEKVFEAATTLQLAAVIVYAIFEKLREPEILENCLERFKVARDAFKDFGALHQISTTTYWIAVVYFEGWAAHWVLKETVLAAFLESERLYDQQRTEISILKPLEAMEMKQRISSHRHVRNLYKLATRVCLKEQMAEELWEWVQKMKARSLSDLLGLGVLVPETITAKVNSDPSVREMFEKELHLAEKVQSAERGDRLGLRAELDVLHSQMQDIPVFQEVFALREGRPVVLKDIQLLLSDMKETHPGLNLIFVDWFTSNDALYLSVIGGSQKLDHVHIIPTNHFMSEVIKWKEEYLDTAKGREESLETDNFDDSPLRELDFLVQPLSQLSEDGDLFVFSVSEAMHSIPIHALWIREEVPIIDVNPVTYCANLTSFTQCWSRAHNRKPEASLKTMIAVYEDTPGIRFELKEQEAVYSSIDSLTKLIDANSLVGPDVRQDSFRQALESSTFLHFHGHGLFTPSSIVEQALLLAPGTPHFSVKQFFELKLRSPHITLIACDSASQNIGLGDEPLGVVTALLCAGASSVIGTLWPIASGSGRLFSEIFYKEIETVGKEGEGWINLALATRKAVLEIKGRPRTRLPYYWASFVLHGSAVYKVGRRD